jgi:hypothetical protein
MVETVAVCAVAGYLAFWSGRALRRRQPRALVASFRELRLVRTESTYREVRPPEVVSSMTAMADAIRTSGLSVRVRDHRLAVVRAHERIDVTLRDTSRVTLASLDIRERGSGTLVFEVALALVPIFGVIAVTEAAFGKFVVDGTRDHFALDEERKERIRAYARAVSQNMTEKLAVWRAGGFGR